MPNFLGVSTDEPVIASFTLKGAGSTKILASGRIPLSLTPVSVSGATCAEQTFAVPGLLVGDFVDITPPGITAGVAPCCARVSAANTLAVTFVNATAGALTPPAGTYQIQLQR